MRKGLVVTLGVVALVLAVSPGFALAPVIGCVPDIVVSDTEQNTQTDDMNFFIYTNALNLDTYVTDADTPKDQLQWSFIETSPASIEINGIGSNTGSTLTPGAFDIRATANGAQADVRNVLWSPTSGSPPFPDPGAATLVSTIQLYVSDGTFQDSQEVFVTSVDTSDNTGEVDHVVPAVQQSFGFAANAEAWTFRDEGLTLPNSSHETANGGRLVITQTTAQGQAAPVYGSWEGPKDPYATAVQARFGCVLRVRYQMSSDNDTETMPGWRMRAAWTKVFEATPGNWAPDFLDLDINTRSWVVYQTPPFGLNVPGRAPGTAGQEYTVLFWPVQTQTLPTTESIVLISADILDMTDPAYAAANPDAGTLWVNQVDVDGFGNPPRGSGRAEADHTYGPSGKTFANWTPNVANLGGGNITGVSATASAGQVAISFGPTNNLFEASITGDPAPMSSGRYYRIAWTLTASTGTGQQLPTARLGVASSRLAYSVDYELEGHGLLARIDTTPTDFEMWMVAPSEAEAGTGLTENMQLRIDSWVGLQPFVVTTRNVAGTLTATEAVTESFDPAADLGLGQ